MSDPEVLTVDEVAELLRCDRKLVYQAIARRELPGVRRIGRVIRVHRGTLLAWLAEGMPPRLTGARSGRWYGRGGSAAQCYACRMQPGEPARPLPLSIADDEAMFHLLVLTRELLVDAERRARAEDPVSRMAAVLVAGTAMETLLRSVAERLYPGINHDRKKAEQIEGDVMSVLEAHGATARSKGKALRVARNNVAHDGSIPSLEDVARHTRDARSVAAEVTRIVWATDLEALRSTSLIRPSRKRDLLEWGYNLLADPAYTRPDFSGKQRTFTGSHPAIAAGFGFSAWAACNGSIIWSRLEAAGSPWGAFSGDFSGPNDAAQRREDALRDDVLAFVFGIPQSDLRRFLSIPHASIGFNPFGAMIVDIHNDPAPDDARFVLDFATDWILRAQVHLRPETPFYPPETARPERVPRSRAPRRR
jgi:excisionase family DNA binding protein